MVASLMNGSLFPIHIQCGPEFLTPFLFSNYFISFFWWKYCDIKRNALSPRISCKSISYAERWKQMSVHFWNLAALTNQDIWMWYIIMKLIPIHLFLGCMYSMAAFGPVLGFLLGAYLLSFHMDSFSSSIVTIGTISTTVIISYQTL